MAKRVIRQNVCAYIEPPPGPLEDLRTAQPRRSAIRMPAHAGSGGAGQAEAVDQFFGPVSRGGLPASRVALRRSACAGRT